jgi:glycosyltransferase involved in cell wall biosynthesis
VVLVGTYPPTACGLATFTGNLRSAIASAQGWHAEVVRLLEHDEAELSAEVVAHWVAGDSTSLARAREALTTYDAVLLQHEYGIYPGADGEEVLDLVEDLTIPLVAVLHTVLMEPSAHQRAVLDGLITSADALVVQSETARQRIVSVHGVDPASIVMIPHGAADNLAGPARDDVPRPSVLTWGLLSPGKGVEHAIKAVARVAARHGASGPTYIVAGQTHPKVRAADGEQYRESLIDLARSLGAADRVRFDDSYRDWESLRALVRSADVVLLPYDSRDQASSGVLVEAIASGKPIIATRFPHAVELLADGAGLLVPHGDVRAIAAALERVLYEPGLAERMAAAARRTARPLLWPAVGESYRSLVERVVRARAVA